MDIMWTNGEYSVYWVGDDRPEVIDSRRGHKPKKDAEDVSNSLDTENSQW